MTTRDVYDDGTQILRRDHLDQWWLVVQMCVQCGKCCMDVPPNWIWYDDERGGCKYLEEVKEGFYQCGLKKAMRPFRCSGNSPHSTVEYCQVRFERVSKEEAVEILMAM